MNLKQTVSPSPQVISQEVAGETVLLDLESECYFGLNVVGTRIWQLINDGVPLQTIYGILLGEYEVEPGQLLADLEKLINSAADQGLITLQKGVQGSDQAPD